MNYITNIFSHLGYSGHMSVYNKPLSLPARRWLEN